VTYSLLCESISNLTVYLPLLMSSIAFFFLFLNVLLFPIEEFPLDILGRRSNDDGLSRLLFFWD
jgi:hypothetical protein